MLHSPAGQGRGEVQGDHNRAESARKVAIGGFVAGGALAAGAMIEFVLSSGESERRMAYAFSTDGRGASGAWTLRF